MDFKVGGVKGGGNLEKVLAGSSYLEGKNVV